MKKTYDEYEVAVGNLGSVHCGQNEKVAVQRFKMYVEISKSCSGRAGNEDVTLLKNGEVIREYVGSQENN